MLVYLIINTLEGHETFPMMKKREYQRVKMQMKQFR
jgi:hypothetical protein